MAGGDPDGRVDDGTPVWQLEAAAMIPVAYPGWEGAEFLWRLTVLLTNEVIERLSVVATKPHTAHSPHHCGFVDVGDDGVRLRTTPSGPARWHLGVPEYARPIGPSPRCTFRRRRRSLVIEWPRGAVGQSKTTPKGSAEHECPAAALPDMKPGFRAEQGTAEASSSLCHQCGGIGTLCCSRCHAVSYCGASCQRAHWSTGHRHRCALASRIASADGQRRRGDPELALASLEDVLRDAGKAVKKEAEKEYTFDADVAAAHLRSFCTAAVGLAAVLVDERVPDAKFCKSAFFAVAVFLDMAAAMGEKRRPEEMQVHLDDIASGIAGNVSKDADPVLSAWMAYDEYAKSMDSRLSKFGKKLPQLKAAALVALRDVFAFAHDLLKVSGASDDTLAAARIDKLLDETRLMIGGSELRHLRPFWPERANASEDSSDSDK